MNKRIIKKFEVAEKRRIDELLAELRRIISDFPDAWLQIWTWKSEFVSSNDDATALFALCTYYGNPDGEYFPDGQVYSALNVRNLETAIRTAGEYAKGGGVTILEFFSIISFALVGAVLIGLSSKTEEAFNVSLVPIGITLMGISGFLAMLFLIIFVRTDWNLL